MFDWNSVLSCNSVPFSYYNSVWHLLLVIQCSVPANGHSTVSRGKGKKMELHLVLKLYTQIFHLWAIPFTLHIRTLSFHIFQVFLFFKWKIRTCFHWIWMEFLLFLNILGLILLHWLKSVCCLRPTMCDPKKVSLKLCTNRFQMAWNMLLNNFLRNIFGNWTFDTCRLVKGKNNIVYSFWRWFCGEISPHCSSEMQPHLNQLTHLIFIYSVEDCGIIHLLKHSKKPGKISVLLSQWYTHQLTDCC